LRVEVAAFKACTGIVALCWATVGTGAPLAGTAAHGAAPTHSNVTRETTTTSPSIVLLPEQADLAGTCGGNAFTVNTFINVTAQSSADVKVSAEGVGTIEEFTDETGKNIGPYDAPYPMFQILAFGGGLAPNTAITISITTYTGPNLSGAASAQSMLQFNCTNGAVLLLQPAPVPLQAIPALSSLGLAATALLLVLVALLTLRRPERVRRPRR